MFSPVFPLSRRLLVTLVQGWAHPSYWHKAGTIGFLPLSSISAGHMASAACALVVLSVLIAGALPARRATVSIRQALCWLYHVSRPPFGSLGPIHGAWTQGKAQAPCRPAKATSGACHASCILRPTRKVCVIWFLISSSCRAFYGMLLHVTVHIAAVCYRTCRLSLIHHTALY